MVTLCFAFKAGRFLWYGVILLLISTYRRGINWGVRCQFRHVKVKMFCQEDYCTLCTNLFPSILMSRGPSWLKAKPRHGVSNCMEEQPASITIPSNVLASTPDAANKSASWLNLPRRGWILPLKDTKVTKARDYSLQISKHWKVNTSLLHNTFNAGNDSSIVHRSVSSQGSH